jgi:hypothetical protein
VPKCVPCLTALHCGGATPACDKTRHVCVECAGDPGECTANPAKSVCNVATNTCVECTKASATKCVGTKPVCDDNSHACVECTATDASKCPSTKQVCDVNVCVECTTADVSKCVGTKPVCETALKTCRGCRADAECKTDPGICADYDQHCATPAEVVTLKGGTCTASGSLYCRAIDAVGALMQTKPILVVTGADPVATLELGASAPPTVLIVGRAGATIGAGSGDTAGIHVSGAHSLYVRDLQVSGGTTGIFAEAGADLHVTRCVVTNNGKGGIKVLDSGFDITNTIIAKNAAGTDPDGAAWAGVRLGALPTGKTGRFANNTVVGNNLIGIACKTTAYDVSTNIAYMNLGGETFNCGAGDCCGPGDPDPGLDATYHIKAGSPCLDKITPTSSPSTVTVDIQSQPRPTALPAKLDCGADEL